MKSRKLEFKTYELVIILLAICIFSTLTGCLVGYKLLTNKTLSKNYSLVDEDLEHFINEYNEIKKNYYGTFDSKKILSNALSAVVNSLGDKYSGKIDLDSNTTDSIKLRGVYTGVGIEIYNDEKLNIIVNSVFKGSPADTSGIKKGDIITKINGENVTGTLTTNLVSKIKSLNNNVFTLEILRDGKYINISTKSDTIELKSATYKVLEQNNKKIGYINISIFANNTAKQFKEALSKLEDEKIEGLIVDVRDNPGGYLETAIEISDLLLNKDKVIYKTNDGDKIEATYSKGKKDYDKKIVILINNGSASASELLTLSLKENLNAYTVGVTSYGKGTVQEVKKYNNIQYKYTTKLWLSPSGKSINETGIIPDLEVKPDNNGDNQLQSALKQFN
ncbi:MAG: S41 family peptidase [Bacillales bacterium]|nr:S41 family peptidase [Bacillales bacterium]